VLAPAKAVASTPTASAANARRRTAGHISHSRPPAHGTVAGPRSNYL
jgi:hypothetical protein